MTDQERNRRIRLFLYGAAMIVGIWVALTAPLQGLVAWGVSLFVASKLIDAATT